MDEQTGRQQFDIAPKVTMCMALALAVAVGPAWLLGAQQWQQWQQRQRKGDAHVFAG